MGESSEELQRKALEIARAKLNSEQRAHLDRLCGNLKESGVYSPEYELKFAEIIPIKQSPHHKSAQYREVIEQAQRGAEERRLRAAAAAEKATPSAQTPNIPPPQRSNSRWTDSGGFVEQQASAQAWLKKSRSARDKPAQSGELEKGGDSAQLTTERTDISGQKPHDIHREFRAAAHEVTGSGRPPGASPPDNRSPSNGPRLPPDAGKDPSSSGAAARAALHDRLRSCGESGRAIQRQTQGGARTQDVDNRQTPETSKTPDRSAREAKETEHRFADKEMTDARAALHERLRNYSKEQSERTRADRQTFTNNQGRGNATRSR